MVATISDPNYSGSAQGTLTIAKATATVTLGNLTATYNGSPQGVTATSNPSGLYVIVTYTVNGASTTKAPTVPGSYAVVGTISDPNYTGSATGTLVINPGAAGVSLSGLAAVYNGKAHAVTATTTPSGLAVTITYNGSSAAPITVGSYNVVATVNSVYFAGSASGTLVISPIAPVVTTGAASALTATSATLAGSANPEGATTTFSFQYGLSSASYSNSTGGPEFGFRQRGGGVERADRGVDAGDALSLPGGGLERRGNDQWAGQDVHDAGGAGLWHDPGDAFAERVGRAGSGSR